MAARGTRMTYATAQMFTVDKATQEKLGIKQKSKRHNMTDGILRIFYMAERDLKKQALTVDEIVAAYYNMYTVTRIDPKERDKKAIIMKLFLMKGGTADNGILETIQKGVYRIRKSKSQYYMTKSAEWDNE